MQCFRPFTKNSISPLEDKFFVARIKRHIKHINGTQHTPAGGKHAKTIIARYANGTWRRRMPNGLLHPAAAPLGSPFSTRLSVNSVTMAKILQRNQKGQKMAGGETGGLGPGSWILVHFVCTSLSLPRMHNNQNKRLPNWPLTKHRQQGTARRCRRPLQQDVGTAKDLQGQGCKVKHRIATSSLAPSRPLSAPLRSQAAISK